MLSRVPELRRGAGRAAGAHRAGAAGAGAEEVAVDRRDASTGRRRCSRWASTPSTRRRCARTLGVVLKHASDQARAAAELQLELMTLAARGRRARWPRPGTSTASSRALREAGHPGRHQPRPSTRPRALTARRPARPRAAAARRWPRRCCKRPAHRPRLRHAVRPVVAAGGPATAPRRRRRRRRRAASPRRGRPSTAPATPATRRALRDRAARPAARRRRGGAAPLRPRGGRPARPGRAVAGRPVVLRLPGAAGAVAGDADRRGCWPRCSPTSERGGLAEQVARQTIAERHRGVPGGGRGRGAPPARRGAGRRDRSRRPPSSRWPTRSTSCARTRDDLAELRRAGRTRWPAGWPPG